MISNAEHSDTETEDENLTEPIENDQTVLKVVAKHAHKNIVVYVLQEDLLKPYDEETRLFFGTYPEMQRPEEILKSSIIAKESQSSLRSFYKNMRSGISDGNVYCKVIDAGIEKWYNLMYTNVFSRKFHGSVSIITMENVTGFRQDELALQFYQNFKRAFLLQNAFLLKFDLTCNKYEDFDGVQPEECMAEAGMTYSDYIRNFSKKMIYVKDREKFLSFMQREGILQAIAYGRTFLENDFRKIPKCDANPYEWLRIKGYIVQDSYSRDSELVFICLNMGDDQKRLQEQTDYVTGVDSREEVTKKIKTCLKTADKSLLSAFVLIGIDSFQQINDKFGHPYGDKILYDTMCICKSLTYKNDLAGRIGGNGFVFFMSGFNEISEIAKKAEMMNWALFQEIKEDMRLTVSIGISVYPKDGTDFETLYKKADAALYQASYSGGNQACFYSQDVPFVRALKEPQERLTEKEENKGVYIRTFGFFDVFINGRAILFRSEKAKEFFAVLVDRRGGYVAPTDIISCLWEEDSTNKRTLSRCRKVAMLLRQTLQEYGIEDIMESQNGIRRIVPEKVNCDLYHYLDGRPGAKDLFRGTYMANYSWGEMTLADLQFHEKP